MRVVWLSARAWPGALHGQPWSTAGTGSCGLVCPCIRAKDCCLNMTGWTAVGRVQGIVSVC